MTTAKRALQVIFLMASTYVVSYPQPLKADAYCDDYIAGCEAGLEAGGCMGVVVATCNPANHNDKSCYCS